MAKVRNVIPYAEGKVIKDMLESAWAAKGLPDKPVAVEKKKKEKEVKADGKKEEEKEEK